MYIDVYIWPARLSRDSEVKCRVKRGEYEYFSTSKQVLIAA